MLALVLGGSPHLYYHDCSGTKSQVTPQGRKGSDQRHPVLCHCQLGQDIYTSIKLQQLEAAARHGGQLWPYGIA